MVNGLWNDPIFGDGGLIATIAVLAWALAVTSVAVSLYRVSNGSKVMKMPE